MLRNPRWRALVLVVLLAAWLAIGAFGGMAQGTLSQVQENDQAAFLPAGAESTRADEAAWAFTEEQSLPALVVVRPSEGGSLSEDQRAAIEGYVEQVPLIELPDGSRLADVLVAPVVAVPSEDGEAVLVPVALDQERTDEVVGPDDERVVNLAVQGLRDLAEQDLPEAGLSAWVTGPAGYIADLVTAFAGIDGILLVVALAVVLVILVFVYRSPILPFVVLTTPVFALCAAALVVKELAGRGVLLLNGQSQGIMAILVVGAATDYALLLVARYREELTRHDHPVAAMVAAWRACLQPILASSGTVIVGLLCLLLSDLGSNASLGPVGSIGIASAVFAALTLLPALLLLAGRRSRALFWPRIPRPGASESGGAHRVATEALWERVARLVTGRARPAWVVTAVVLLGMAAFVPTLRADGTGESEVFLTDVDAVAGQEVLAEHFAVGQVQPLVVITAQDRAEDVLEAVRGVEGVDGAELLTDEEQDPVVVDGLVLLEAVTAAAAETQEAVTTAAEVRAAVQEVDPDALVGGAAAQRLDTQITAAQDLRTIIPVVLVAILLMLMLLLRAVVAPLLLLAVNVLSFAATMGLAAVVFNHVLGLPGADATVPLFGFVFLVALSIDYSIFLMTRVREESLTSGTRAGVRRGLAVTGGVITSAGLVLAATFSALAVIPLLFMAQLAFIVAAGVLIDTFVVRTVLVPGLIHDIGRPVWWPGQRRFPAG